jgi:CelD/BcsL family acetyltransferase involved in cellulose biosynthesis
MVPGLARPALRTPDQYPPAEAASENIDPHPNDAKRGANPASAIALYPQRVAAVHRIFDQDQVDQSRADRIAHRLAHANALQVVVVENEAELCNHVSAWQDLADHAMEANVFYEPWLLMPALKTLHRGTPLRLVFIYETGSPGKSGASRLCGFFPPEPDSRFRNLPIRAWRLWKHTHCFLCTPLIRPARARETLAALLQWAGGDGHAHVLDFSHVRGDGPFHDVLITYVKEAGTMQRVTNRFSRALWKAEEGLDDYLQDTLSAGVRKEYRRQRKRLAELGRLEFRTLREGREVDDWLKVFLDLEASGWKAREGQALGLNADHRNFVLAAAQLGFARGQVLLQGLFLDGRPVAMLLSFLAGSGGFAFKIAYDETLAKYSPGVQMMLDILGNLHSDSRFAWMDSCAEPDHPMINRLWKDQKVIESVLASTGNWRDDLAVAVFPAGQRLVRLIRALKKMTPRMKLLCAQGKQTISFAEPANSSPPKGLHALR